jgi:molybdopterin biosynthesis enzyme
MLSFFHFPEPEEKSILDALGQVLAEDVVSGVDKLLLANSAMDGYAVQFDSLRGVS